MSHNTHLDFRPFAISPTCKSVISITKPLPVRALFHQRHCGRKPSFMRVSALWKNATASQVSEKPLCCIWLQFSTKPSGFGTNTETVVQKLRWHGPREPKSHERNLASPPQIFSRPLLHCRDFGSSFIWKDASGPTRQKRRREEVPGVPRRQEQRESSPFGHRYRLHELP